MQNIIITDPETLQDYINAAVSKAIAEAIPAAIRKATRKPWLTGPEVCDLLGVSKRTLHHLRKTRRIPFSQSGRTISYPAEGIEKYLQANRIKARIESDLTHKTTL